MPDAGALAWMIAALSMSGPVLAAPAHVHGQAALHVAIDGPGGQCAARLSRAQRRMAW